MMIRLKVLGWYGVGHIMKKQNGKEGRGPIASWEDEFARYTPPNKVVEMEVEALLANDGTVQKKTSNSAPFQGGGNEGIEGSCSVHVRKGKNGKGVEGGGCETKGEELEIYHLM